MPAVEKNCKGGLTIGAMYYYQICGLGLLTDLNKQGKTPEELGQAYREKVMWDEFNERNNCQAGLEYFKFNGCNKNCKHYKG